MMNSKTIESGLYSSIDHLFRNDLFLLIYDVHERTIAHRLAVYLEHKFAGFHVDCEYNNDLDSETGRKQVYYPNSSSGTGAYPDIIVHHRGLNGPNHNLLAIEIKKKSFAATDIDHDREKLCSYTASDGRNHLSYERGALVVLGVRETAGQFLVEWYENGRIVTNPKVDG
jgi:hypothetical protein